MSVPYLPNTAAELIDAIQNGVLVEGLNVDAKADLEPGIRGNTRLAIDLAAMAVSGGLIVVGAAEEGGDSGRKLIPRPIALGGLRERVSQVGLSRVDPPLYVATRELAVSDDPQKLAEGVADSAAPLGFLLIVVPPSPDAPHMVDERYRGRSDTTNHVLGDAEVRRIQAQRRREQRDIREELHAAIARDPLPADMRQHAHLFVVARPVVATSQTMLEERLGRDWQKWLHRLAETPHLGLFEPDLPSASNNTSRRVTGWAVSSYPMRPNRALEDDATEDDVVELEVDEDGTMRLFCGRASASHSSNDTRWAFEDLLFGLTWRVIRAAAEIALLVSYLGNWDFGVALTNARGISSHAVSQRGHWVSPYSFSEDTYEEVTQATFVEITEHRRLVLERLVGRLNRALNDGTIPIRDFDGFGGPGN